MEQGVTIWQAYSEALTFCGSSLLAPVGMAAAAGLDPAFWVGFPDFGDGDVARAIGACEEFAKEAQARASMGSDVVQDVSAEFARLFVGPPRPAVPPWESLYGPDGARGDVGLGKAAIEMQGLIANAELEMPGGNDQHADHIGVELLYAASLCERMGKAPGWGASELSLRLDNFIGDHPLGWVGDLRKAVKRFAPDGYYVGILALAEALLLSLPQHLRMR